MGFLHDKIADKIAQYFIINKTFGNRYMASIIPIFPKPDVILLSLSKKPEPQIAFEIKPPHANKREYLTGIGQAVSYLMTFPLVYIVLPDEIIDGLHIPSFIKDIAEKTDLKIGVISYSIVDFEPIIIKEASLEEKINIIELENRINDLKPRAWLFWMDTSIEEVGKMLTKISEIESKYPNDKIKNIVLDEIWNEVLTKRYPKAKRPESFKLNYKLLFDTLNFWTGSGSLTVLGNRLYEICKKYGVNSNEFKDAFHYIILTEGGYLRILILIDKLQTLNKFRNKGDSDKLNNLINEIRKKYGAKGKDIGIEKERILPEYEKLADDCWFKVIGIELFKNGFGRSLTQINEELRRRFSPYFQSQLKTEFFINKKFIKNKGYAINWERIIELIQKGDKNLEIF
ncbi:MAG: hypothetical protein ACTSPY_04045 [Candidatus Helarchaeota archaeon]